MNRLFIILVFLFFACSTDKVESTLQSIIGNKEIVLDNVIACAASNPDDGLVSVFLYPREGASNLQYFETETSAVDKNDFSNYVQVEAPLLEVFNGYLLRFEVAVSTEKWVILTFDEDGKTHLSNPIRLKQIEKPTEYSPQNITVNSTNEAMPLFLWQDGAYDDTKIYFQVVSDAQDNLLSGTYTFEQKFQYYLLDNVVLNITRDIPPALEKDVSYSFTLMAVSEDNWVNLFSVVDFDLGSWNN